jgi:hypothetical protein
MTGIPDDYFQEGVLCQRSLVESSRLSREDLRAWAWLPRSASFKKEWIMSLLQVVSDVAVNYRERADAANAVRAEITGMGRKAIAVPADCTTKTIHNIMALYLHLSLRKPV